MHSIPNFIALTLINLFLLLSGPEKRKKYNKTKVNALPHRARECENGRLFSDINDRKLMSVFGRD